MVPSRIISNRNHYRHNETPDWREYRDLDSNRAGSQIALEKVTVMAPSRSSVKLGRLPSASPVMNCCQYFSRGPALLTAEARTA